MARPSAAPAEPAAARTPQQVLDRLDFTVLRRLEGILQGDHRSLFRGGGVDFTDLRNYEPQDDIRHIDWNVTARTNEPFVRQFVEDRDLTAWFLLDRSASMQFGGDPDKYDMSVDTVVSLARLLTKGGNRVGAMLWNNGVEATLEPRTGRKHVLRLANEMLKLAPGGADGGSDRDSSRARRPTDLCLLGEHALGALRRRCLVFVVSDFITEPGWERPFTQLARRHEVVAIRMVDPAETELPDAGIMVMEDAETGEQLFVDTGDAAFRGRFHEAAELREEAIATAARRSGLDLHSIGTSDDLVRALVGLARRRTRLRR